MNEEEEKKDPEEELKEEKERYERQNQEAYDEVTKGNEELRRRAEEEQKRIDDILEDRPGETSIERRRRISRQMGRYNKGKKVLPPDADIQTEGNLKGQPKPEDIFGPDYKRKPTYLDDPKDEEDTNPRFAESIGFEVGANVALVKATAGLLVAPIPGARALYALSNVAGSGIINYLAQRIRGTEFSLGELATASGLSLIPGGTQAKTVKGAIGKSTVKGAGLGATQVTSESLIDTGELPDAETLATGALFGGVAGGLFQTAADSDEIFKALGKRIKNPLDDAITVYAMSPEYRKGGFSDDAERRIAEIQKQLRVEKGDQLGLFTNEGDKFLYEKYKKQNRVIQTPDPTRQQASRVLRPTDFDIFLEEDPNITVDHVLGYIESVKAAKSGKPVLNPATNRFIRNQKGLDGTLRFLNEKAAPNAKFDLNEIADELSAEFNTTITPADISNMIKGNVKAGVVSFKTQGMAQPMQLKSIADLRKVYMARIARYKDIPAFERGHVFAADNIIKDKRISNLTDFKNNLEPEIARSIYRQLDDEALEELIRLNADSDFDNIESLYEQVLAGNRSRRNVDDPDKVIAALYGKDYGLRESFLNYVYPNRSLGRLITADSKAAFADLYKKELAQRLSAYQGLSIGPDALDKIRADVAQEVLKSFPDVDSRFVIEQMTLANDKAFLKDMVDPTTGEAK